MKEINGQEIPEPGDLINYLIFKVSYDKAFVFSHEDGMKLIDLFRKARFLDEKYSNEGKDKIRAIQKDDMHIRLMGQEEYLEKSMEQLLNPNSENKK